MLTGKMKNYRNYIIIQSFIGIGLIAFLTLIALSVIIIGGIIGAVRGTIGILIKNIDKITVLKSKLH